MDDATNERTEAERTEAKTTGNRREDAGHPAGRPLKRLSRWRGVSRGRGAVGAVVLAVGIALGLTACDAADPQPANPEPRELTATEKSVVERDNTFGLKLFRSVAEAEFATNEPPSNTLVSPLSVSMALGMTLNGATGETREAIEQTLNKQGLSEAEINDAYRGLIDLLEDLDPSVQVALANSMWFDDSLEVKQPFIDVNQEHFDARIDRLDFRDTASADVINDWVKDKTGGNIETIVEKPLPGDVVAYLINATYFRGQWKTKFDPDDTQSRDFTRPDGSTVSVPMMERTEDVELAAWRGENARAVDIPYGDSLYTMTILLPDRDTDLRSVVQGLDAERWSTITEELAPQSFSLLRLPRFTVEYEKELRPILTDLGMGVAFSTSAEFEDLSPLRLLISRVTHKTTIRVDENGTEASAATAVGFQPVSLSPQFVVDRPFAFAIRENHSGTILFAGTVTDPS